MLPTAYGQWYRSVGLRSTSNCGWYVKILPKPTEKGGDLQKRSGLGNPLDQVGPVLSVQLRQVLEWGEKDGRLVQLGGLGSPS